MLCRAPGYEVGTVEVMRKRFQLVVIGLVVATQFGSVVPVQAATKAENAFVGRIYKATATDITETLDDDAQVYYMLGLLEEVYSVSSNRADALTLAKNVCSRLNASSSKTQLKLTEAYASRVMLAAVNALTLAETDDDFWFQVAYIGLLDSALRDATAKNGLCPKQSTRGKVLYKNVERVVDAAVDELIALTQSPEFSEEYPDEF
jgi:hypothetical protein